MMIISIQQPYAWLLAIGLKRFETRSWHTGYRGKIALHASRRTKESDEYFSDLMDDCDDLFRSYNVEAADDLAYGAIVGVADMIECHQSGRALVNHLEFRLGNFGAGRYAWELSKPVLLPEPIPWKGAQGLRNLDPLVIPEQYR